uniref:Uncharacterized protein n=1 Tax=Anguilla anguilla TaxID=7936 RepID=A0A0E9X412_ANGAN
MLNKQLHSLTVLHTFKTREGTHTYSMYTFPTPLYNSLRLSKVQIDHNKAISRPSVQHVEVVRKYVWQPEGCGFKSLVFQNWNYNISIQSTHNFFGILTIYL